MNKNRSQFWISTFLILMGIIFFILVTYSFVISLIQASQFVDQYLMGRGSNYYKDIYFNYSILFAISMIFILPGWYILTSKRKFENTYVYMLLSGAIIMIISYLLEALPTDGEKITTIFIFLIGIPGLIFYIISLTLVILNKSN